MSLMPSEALPWPRRWIRAVRDALSVLRHGATHLRMLDARADAAEAQAHGLQSRVALVETASQQLSQTLHQHLPAQTAHLQALQAHADAVGAHLKALDAELSALRHRLGLHRPQLAPGEREAFYWALEAEFRGDAADVQQRQSVYRHWLEKAPSGPVIDLGCGRGEWLELLPTWGRQGLGLDASALNVAQGRAKGLSIEEGDALIWLAQRFSSSAAAITAFHLAEHLPFDDLHLLVRHAQRVLQPGGLLILETPNPENWGVAAETFWLDPTHRRPLPPALLAALARACGLEVLTVLRLNPPDEDPGPIESERLLQAVVQGRDCALVARKPEATPA